MKYRFLLLVSFFAFNTAFGQTAFVPGNLLVLKSGNGLNSGGAQVIAFEEMTKGGQLVQTIAIPSSGANQFTLTSNVASTIEGLTNLSNAGDHVTFAGYDAPAGTPFLQNSASSVKRAIGRLDKTGSFDVVKTTMTGGVSTVVRSAVQVDIARTWTVGEPSFLQYTNMSTSSSTNTWSTANSVSNNTNVSSFENYLYFTSASTTKGGMYKVNTDNNRFPDSSTDSKPEKLNLPGLGANPNGFAIFDVDGDANPDLIYIADEVLGLQKYYFNGTSWSAKGIFPVPVTSTDRSLRSLAGTNTGGAYVIYGNTNSSIFSFTDVALPLANISVTANLLATAPNTYLYRGLSFTPGTNPEAPKPETYALRMKNNTDLIKTINSNVTTREYPGMEETRLTYTDNNNGAMSLYILTANLASPNIRLEAQLPANRPSTFSLQTVKGQVPFKNLVDPDWQVLGAVNGDYWYNTPQTGTPLGLVYINGLKVKDIDSPDGYYNYFLAVENNGKATIGTKSDFLNIEPEVKWGLGGRFWLVRERDEFIPTGTADTLKQPRTVVGLFSQDKVVFIVIDGRRPGHSVGFTQTESTKMFRALGVTQALNLDGGGSSTMVTREPDGSYLIINKPSDGDGSASYIGRQVATTWQIIGRTVPLPINLGAFTAKVENGKGVRLNWTTLSETNNDRFELYRSSTNKFDLPFATIKGAGTSTGVNRYTYLDKTPAEGTNYYVLKQVDTDGKNSDSEILAVKFGLENEKSSVFYTDNVVSISTYSISETKATVNIFNTSGSKVYAQDHLTNKGANIIPINFSKTKGVYILQITKGGNTETMKFVN